MISINKYTVLAIVGAVLLSLGKFPSADSTNTPFESLTNRNLINIMAIQPSFGLRERQANKLMRKLARDSPAFPVLLELSAKS